jgi:fluoride exporter
MSALAWVGVGLCGALGAYARFRVGAAVTARRPSDFPFGTFVVNLSGAFALGLLTGLVVDGEALLVLGSGFLGGYTTFSTWMVEAHGLGERTAWLYLLGSLAGGLAAAGAGWLAGGVLD